MTKPIKHKINGKEYEIDVEDCYVGLTVSGKINLITLPNGLAYGNSSKAKQDLLTLLHECIHAMDMKQSEKKVEQSAQDIGILLWKLGYRRVKA